MFSCVACGKLTQYPEAGCTCTDCWNKRKELIAMVCDNCGNCLWLKKTADNISVLLEQGIATHRNPDKLIVVKMPYRKMCPDCSGKELKTA